MELRDRLAQRAPPAHAWAWDEVIDRLGALGTEIPIRIPLAQAELGCTFLFTLDTNTLFACVDNLQQGLRQAPERHVEFEATLAHEMTHAAHLRRIRTYSGFTGLEIKSFQEHCSNLNTQMMYMAETLGNFNGAAYYAAYGSLDAAVSWGTDPTILDIYRLFSGAPGAERNFMRALVSYVAWAQSHLPPRPSQRCNPMVMLRGPHAGEYFFLSDVTPEIVPLLEHVLSFRPTS
jgi:hypothetical protein